MRITKGTDCILSEVGHYNMFYMSQAVTQFNKDCIVEPKPYINAKNNNYIAVLTQMKNIGFFEDASNSTREIIVWIKTS